MATLKATAGFVRFTPTEAGGAEAYAVFQVGTRNAVALTSLSNPLTDHFTAFECAMDPDGGVIYDTVIYISNRNAYDIQVAYKITNAENGQNVGNSFVTIGVYKMLAFSMVGALKQ